MNIIKTIFLCALLSACALEEEPVGSDEDADVEGVTALAVVVTQSGAELTFSQLDTGGIAVSELVRSGDISPMNALMTGADATPLELFLAVAPPQQTAPFELEAAHTKHARARGVDSTPRALSLKDIEPNAAYSWYYAADCDLSDDGGWFDNFWQTYGWNWHWYSRTTDYDGWSPTTPKRVAVQSHLCNDGPSGTKIHRVRRSSCGNTSGWSYVFTAEVTPEYRSQYRVWDDPVACYFKNMNSSKIGNTSFPTYSHGITTP